MLLLITYFGKYTGIKINFTVKEINVSRHFIFAMQSNVLCYGQGINIDTLLCFHFVGTSNKLSTHFYMFLLLMNYVMNFSDSEDNGTK